MTISQTDTLQTGIDVLDRKLNGGIPKGTVTALTADPASQSELFLYEIAATRPTVYLSTIRAGTTVKEAFESQQVGLDDVEAIRVDPETPVEHARDVVAELPADANLIVDPVGVLEEGNDKRYRQFLSDLKERASETRGVVLLHCLQDDTTPAKRRDTLHLADLVFELTTEVRGDSVVNRLAVPKFRGGQSMKDVVKLNLTTEVEVDMSRNIV